jgi:hypothetical protein
MSVRLNLPRAACFHGAAIVFLLPFWGDVSTYQFRLKGMEVIVASRWPVLFITKLYQIWTHPELGI